MSVFIRKLRECSYLETGWKIEIAVARLAERRQQLPLDLFIGEGYLGEWATKEFMLYGYEGNQSATWQALLKGSVPEDSGQVSRKPS